MKKLSLFFLSLLICAVASAETNKLNLFIWSEYIDPEIISNFEKKFDCKVITDLYEDSESMLAKIEGGGVSLYDIAVPPDYIVSVMIKKKLLAALNMSNIPNAINVDDKFVNPSYDPGNAYSMPYQWGTVGIYARKKAGQTIDESWGILFDPKMNAGSFVMIDSMRESIDSALKYKGYSINTTEPAKLKEARDLLLDAKKRTLGFESGVGGKNKVLGKGATFAVAYSGDAVRGMSEDPETYYFVPREGSEIWVDNMVIPAKAPHKEMAEKFINYILDPEVGAKLSDFNQYATPNKASLLLIDQDDRKNPAIYPSKEVMAKLEFVQDLGSHTRIFDQVWTEVKTK
ncbi:MAG: spermidine/putrescine ABC transporter substrate-binding protein [bacterium]|nr:spermidine/putrescine ABC transporter substrate-binding protein [bacterium]